MYVDRELDILLMSVKQLKLITRSFGLGKLQISNGRQGFAIKTSLVPKLLGKPKAINDRLMSVRLPLTKNLCATLISVYATTKQYPDEDKNMLYSQLRTAIDGVPRKNKLIILGDFNARVGADWPTWEGVLGRHGVGQCNSNGHLLLETCIAYDLHTTNSNSSV